jgi:hypothetical protein
LIITLISGNLTAVSAFGPDAENDAQPEQVVLKGGYVATVIDYTEDGRPIYQADFGAPTYCEDLKTPIDTRWHEQPDGSFRSGANLFDSSVSNEQITVAKDAESIRWMPELSLAGADNGKGLILKARNAKPEVLETDPLNENYTCNTLVWHYDHCIDRCFRLIEGLCQEYFVISQPLEHDLVIDPQAIQTENFTAYKKASAYDALRTRIQLTEDGNKIITLKSPAPKSQLIRGMCARRSGKR